MVIPVYNESQGIGATLEAWSTELARIGIDHEILAYDDGSSDGSGQVLEDCSRRLSAVRVRSHANRGHGPTILRGYLEAEGEWIFQVDGDDELPADRFSHFWERRDDFDFLVGIRENRRSPLSRRFISAISRWTVHAAFGRGVYDVNCPYRLMRQSWLRRVARRLAADTFAPNVILSGLAARHGLRIYQHPVPYRPRRTGQVSITRWKLWRAAFKSFRQTVRLSFTLGRDLGWNREIQEKS